MERAGIGQYRVLGRAEQHIWIEYSDGTTEKVGIDRCKAARRLKKTAGTEQATWRNWLNVGQKKAIAAKSRAVLSSIQGHCV